MPVSLPYNLSLIAETVWRLRPKTVLDVGCGDAKYGVIFRSYLDIIAERYRRGDWKTRIDGIEIFPPYLTPVHAYIYDTVHVGDALLLLPQLGEYDLVFLGDVLEHFERADGHRLVDMVEARWLLISTPAPDKIEERQPHGNTHESHRYFWSMAEFHELAGWHVKWARAEKIWTILLEKDEDNAGTV